MQRAQPVLQPEQPAQLRLALQQALQAEVLVQLEQPEPELPQLAAV